MHRMIASGLIVLDTFFLLSFPPAIAQTTRNSNCAAAVSSARNRLKRGKNVSIKVEKGNKPQEYKDYPQNRPSSYHFVFPDGSAAASLMKSPELLAAISTDVMKKCPDVSIVLIGYEYSDDYFLFGFVGENKVKTFDCIHPGEKRELRWGYYRCV